MQNEKSSAHKQNYIWKKLKRNFYKNNLKIDSLLTHSIVGCKYLNEYIKYF